MAKSFVPLFVQETTTTQQLAERISAYIDSCPVDDLVELAQFCFGEQDSDILEIKKQIEG